MREERDVRKERKEGQTEYERREGAGVTGWVAGGGGEAEKVEECSIIVGNLSLDCDEDSLYLFFFNSGFKPSATEIIMRDGQSKGFGYADFSNKSVAQNVIKTLSGTVLLGRCVRLDLADSCNRNSTTPRESRFFLTKSSILALPGENLFLVPEKSLSNETEVFGAQRYF
uniref:RRM domain-containing protein n=1 Tax=Amphimedon queenslandica TaxID=400682 RepID=A0A1X7U3R8_AMPQE